MKHTPGPWTYSAEVLPETFGRRFQIHQQDGAPYTPHYSDVCDTLAGDPIEVQRANAALIAAAPELLDALELCRKHMYAHASNTDDGAFDKLCAAIKKATT